MNFFQSIVAMQAAGDWTITIAKEGEDKLAVSVLFFNNANGDSARKLIPPVLLKGTPQELDEGFFNSIEQPVKQTAQLFVNMEQYLKGQELAKVSSQMEKDRIAKGDKDKSDKQKKFDEAMKKADELEKDGKFREAWVKVPDPNDYPEQAEQINERRSELSAQFPPDLFK